MLYAMFCISIVLPVRGWATISPLALPSGATMSITRQLMSLAPSASSLSFSVG